MGNQTRRGSWIQIFLPDEPSGLRTVEKSNWTGQGIVCPRSLFPSARGEPQFGRTGVYVLTGPPDEEDQPRIYIGEGDPILPRLEAHNAAKDFWTLLIAFTSKDDSLNKAHVQYLESRLVALAQEAKRCVIDNAQIPQRPTLANPDQAATEAFLDEVLLILPVLALSVFEKPPKATAEQVLHLKSKGLQTRGYVAPQGFVVVSGSQAVKKAADSTHNYILARRKVLLDKGVLVEDGDFFKLTQDYVFDSPSTAAGVLLGRTANGRIEWKDENNVTLKELQSHTS